MRNVTRMSPQTQNELIEVMGKHIVLRNIVDELKAARRYAILADEVTSHNIEHLAICARFVDQNNGIREEFLAFIGLDRITGAKIADAIVKFLQDNDVPVANMRGQGYDGASNMSSDRVGVQASVCCSREVKMDRAIEKSKDDLPSPELHVISTELRSGKHGILEYLWNFGRVLQLQPSRTVTVICTPMSESFCKLPAHYL